MKHYFKHLLFIFTITAVFLGCKKDNAQNESLTNQTVNVTEKLKAWYNEHPVAQITKSSLLAKDEVTIKLQVGEPIWVKTTYFLKDNISITPIKDFAKSSEKSSLYLITEQENNKIVNGYICYVLSHADKQVEITPEVLNAKQIAGFTGAIVKYDLNGDFISSNHFENGYLGNGKTDLILGKKNTAKGGNATSNLAPTECYTIDHWWVTWDTETLDIISIDYEGSTEVCSNGGGGGGGGGNPTPPSNTNVAQAAAQHILNSLDTLSQTEVVIDESETATTRTKLYTWKCVKNPTWYILAYDKGVHKKKNGNWQWDSLENLGISVGGFVPGGTLTATKNYANATVGISNAIMDLSVNVASQVTVSGAPITYYHDFNSHKTWNINDNANSGY